MPSAQKYKTAMVFGVFDGLHEGHKHFLKQAHEKCDQLIVVLTLPEIVSLLKQKLPKQSYEERAASIRSLLPHAHIIPSDSALGQWNIFKKYNPEMILLGYDQKGIANELQKIGRPFVFLEPHHPEKYKSSILNSAN